MTRVVVDPIETQQDKLRFGDPQDPDTDLHAVVPEQPRLVRGEEREFARQPRDEQEHDERREDPLRRAEAARPTQTGSRPRRGAGFGAFWNSREE